MRRIWRSLKLGMKSLMLHKLRSGLTVLGIVFGVAAVISMLAVGEGSSREAQRRFQELGATNIIYRSVKPSDEAQAMGGRGPARILNYGLKYTDYERLLATVPTIKKALPIREIRKEIRHLHRAIDGRVVGTTQDYAEFNHLEVERGRFLSVSDNEHYENFAVLAHATAATLFPYEDPIGQTVKLGEDYYTVIGVTAERGISEGGGDLGSQDFNKDVYIPLNTCRLRFGERIIDRRSGQMSAEETQLSQITLQVGSIDEVLSTAPVIEAAVKPYHLKRDAVMIVPLTLLREAQKTAQQWSFVLGTIASISLLVGGIGIMNIMLATVTERTREIGIRRALGAKRRDIIEQFLIESVVLSGVGGLLGLSLGVTVPFAIVYFAAMKAVVTWDSVILSFGISVLVGIIFGLYPARRASLMDPIEALRHE
jgi:putative ABC transport system permease protein